MYSHRVFDPYLTSGYYSGHNEEMARRSRIYEPDELPFWLAIGPIYWEASYNRTHWYVKAILDKGYINFGKDEISG